MPCIALHAGADPLETIQKKMILWAWAYIKLNFMGNVYVGEIF